MLDLPFWVVCWFDVLIKFVVGSSQSITNNGRVVNRCNCEGQAPLDLPLPDPPRYLLGHLASSAPFSHFLI